MGAWATTRTRLPPTRVEGKPFPGASAPAGCAARRCCRAASASPGPPRPQASRRRRWPPGRRPVLCPGCRPQPPGRRTAAAPGPSTRRRSNRAWCGSAFVVSMPARTASAPSTSPACLSRRASWTLLATLGVSVAGAVSGCSENSAAITRSTSSSRLRLGRTAVSIVRLPVANVALVITTSFVLCCLVDCALVGKEEGPPPAGDDPCVLGWV